VARTRDVNYTNAARRQLAMLAVAMLATNNAVLAQGGRANAPRFQPELRADFIDARTAAAHAGVGFSVPASTYVRLGLVGGFGRAWADGKSTWAGRIDGVVRFVVDPLREFRWAPYGSGGVGGLYDGDGHWRAVLVGVLGIEGPKSGPIVPAIEAGFGGGARFGLSVRRAMPGRR
jgi:hypothetical protein